MQRLQLCGDTVVLVYIYYLANVFVLSVMQVKVGFGLWYGFVVLVLVWGCLVFWVLFACFSNFYFKMINQKADALDLRNKPECNLVLMPSLKALYNFLPQIG